MPKNIIVSNRLPVQAQKGNDSWSFTPTSGGLATGMKSVHQEGDSLWVGWPGISSDILDKKSKNQITQDLAENHLYPVFLNEDELDNFYFGFTPVYAIARNLILLMIPVNILTFIKSKTFK